MDDRQKTLLLEVIENFIKTAEPVGSKFLVRERELGWSEATVRNDLRSLEEAGYLTHPHTSAGRVPTSRGYRFYVDHTDFASANANKRDAHELESVAREKTDLVNHIKRLARTMVELSNETVLVAFSRDSVYYTGLSNLLQKPDFKEVAVMASLGSIFDRCEELVPQFFRAVDTSPHFYVGDEHPFGSLLTTLSVRFGENGSSMLTLLGPERMDYRRNWALFNKVLELV